MEDRLTSLPIEIVLEVALLLDTKDVIRLWRVSKTWSKIFRSDQLCKPVLKAILEDTYPNFVADRSAAKQLVYHNRRLQRFYDYDICGTTHICLGKDHTVEISKQYQTGMAYHDGKFVWLDKLNKLDGNEEYPTRINVRSLLHGFILRKEPDAPTGLHKVGICSRLVAVTSLSRPSDYSRTCFVWNMETGEERSFQLFDFASSVPEPHNSLVIVRNLSHEDNRFQVWNYELRMSYVIDPRIPEMDAGVQEQTRSFMYKNSIYHLGINHCHESCMQGGSDYFCEEHAYGEALTTFCCAKSSIANGSLLSFQSETIRTVNPRGWAVVSQHTPANRQGLFSYHMIASENKSSSLHPRPRTGAEAEAEDEYPLLLSLFQYDMTSNKISIQQQGCIASERFITFVEMDAVNCCPWKEMVHSRSRWAEDDITFRVPLDTKSEPKVQILKYVAHGDLCFFLVSIDDMCTVEYENDQFVARWFDPLAYEQARRVCDKSDF